MQSRSVSVVVAIGIGLAAALELSPRLYGQNDQSVKRPTFEVASIKPSPGGDGFSRVGLPPGRFTASNTSLTQLIAQAYQVQRFQIEGEPQWRDSARFDIDAKLEGDFSSRGFSGLPQPVQLMLQSLLADRFRLVVHRETKQLPLYALTLANSDGTLGTQLHKAEIDCLNSTAQNRGNPPPAPRSPGLAGLPSFQCGMRALPGTLQVRQMPLSQLAFTLTQILERQVIDRTGLTGRFDFDLKWTPDQMPAGLPAFPDIDPNGPSMFTALQEQLGLKLESTRGPVEVLVIEHAERPSPD